MGVAIEVAEFGPVRRWRMSRTLFGRPLFYAAVFWLDGLVIDAGPTTAWEGLEPELAKLPVKALVVTHHHEDHSGNVARIAARFGCPVLAHPGAVEEFTREGWDGGWYRRMVWGPPAYAKATPIGEEVATEKYRLRVIPTPGHAPDHVCLHEAKEGLLFTGDVFLHEKLKMMRNDEDLPMEVESLESLMGLPSSRLFCCHNPRVVDDHREAISAKIAHLRGLRDRAHELRAAGADAEGIRDELLGRDGFLAFVSHGRMSKRNLVDKLLAWERG